VVAPANFLDWQREGKAFESLSAVEQFGERDFNMAAAAIPESVKGVRFSAELFQVLQVQPILGEYSVRARSKKGSLRLSFLDMTFG
jgi:hypothetical protein